MSRKNTFCEGACDVAVASTVIGALACTTTLSVTEGQYHVTAIVRVAVIFVALAVGAIGLRLRASSKWFRPVTVFTAFLSAAAFGSVFGLVGDSQGSPRTPLEMVGVHALVPAIVYVGALLVAALAQDESSRQVREPAT